MASAGVVDVPIVLIFGRGILPISKPRCFAESGLPAPAKQPEF